MHQVILPGFGTLGHALRTAKQDDVIVLSDGVYEEATTLLVNVENVTVRSASQCGTAVTILNSVSDGPLMHIKAGQFCLEHVKISPGTSASCLAANPKRPDCSILISGRSACTVSHCKILGGMLAVGIEIREEARPRIRHCEIVKHK